MYRCFAVAALTVFSINSFSFSDDHFFVRIVSDQEIAPFTKNISSSQSCREQIKKVICLVDPQQKDQKPEDRQCLPGGETYAHFFEELYDNYPLSMQKMFCSLRFLFIEKDFIGTAYAGVLKDKSGKLLGAIMGVRQTVLDSNLDLTTWATWKEQLNFGANPKQYEIDRNLPLVTTTSAGKSVSDFLYFVITHEFGHIFDFSNNLNATLNCPEQDPEGECEMAPGSWGALSWKSNKKPLPGNDFPLRTSLCFYWCESHPIGKSQVNEVYSDLSKVPFLSTYATSQPWDDFADSLAYFLMAKQLGSRYALDTRQGLNLDTMEKLSSELFKTKYDYLSEFINRADIVYP